MQPLSLSKEQVDSVIALYSSGKIQEAINAIKALNENYPNVPLLFNILGVCYETLGELDAAATMFKTAVTIKPDYAEAHFNLGVVQKGIEQPELSIESYRKAIAIKPNYPDAHNNLGNVFLDLNQYDNAVEHFEWAVAYKPEFAEAFNNLGVANREIDQFDNAVKNFKRAIELNPQYTQAHLNLGNIFKDLGQRDSAAKCFEKAIANEPDNAQAHVNLGTAFKEEGQIKDAIKSFKKAIQVNPNYGVAYFNLINMKGNKVGVGQLELASLDQVAAVRESLVKAMEEVKADGRHTVLLMLTDVVKEGTDLVVLSDDPAMIEKAFDTKLDGNSMWIPGMMSRKKQTVPNLQNAFGC